MRNVRPTGTGAGEQVRDPIARTLKRAARSPKFDRACQRAIAAILEARTATGRTSVTPLESRLLHAIERVFGQAPGAAAEAMSIARAVLRAQE